MTTRPIEKLMALLLVAAMLAACSSSDDAADGVEPNDTGSGQLVDAEDGAEAEHMAEETTAPNTDVVDEPLDEEAVAAVAPNEAEADGSLGDDGVFTDDTPTVDRAGSNRVEDNTFGDYGIRPFVDTDRDPRSTFALDVDTASYRVANQWIREGRLPPVEAVRVEEFVNSFDYDYDAPSNGLRIAADAGPSLFEPGNVILRLGVQAQEVRNADRPNANLTFVIDTSGSMDRDNRIGLVKRALERLVAELDTDDTVAIVTYGDGAAVLLEPTTIRDRDRVLEVIDGLRTDGSTNLEAGLRRGYELADTAYVPGGINRVVLASDGVANVGLTDPNGLVGLIRDDADRGIQLVTIGVGMGNFNDVVMETLANDGDGFYAYVDDLTEAERLFSDELVSTLLTVAIDAKIQVEFDDDAVESYRLLGYENRAVLDDDFRNDDVDAGELGAGHQATALYELVLRDGLSPSDRLATVSMRWEDPDDGNVIETRLELTGSLPELRWSDTTEDFRLAVTVAALAEVLRASPHADGVDLDDVAREIEEFERTWAVDELAELVESARRLR